MTPSLTYALILVVSPILSCSVRDRTPPRESSISRDVVSSTSSHTKAASPHRLQWGVYQIYWGLGYERVLRRELAQFGSTPQYVMFYRDLGRRYPRKVVDIIRRAQATPIVSLELWRWESQQRSELEDLDSGQYDEFFRQWARAASDHGGRLLLRPGFEMNGEWFSWSGDPARFVQVWRRVHEIFRREGATNVEWIWCPNVVSIPRTPENDMNLYYPGDDVVDWVAVDGYNFGDHHSQWHRWTSFREIFEEVLDDFRRRYPDKPIMIAETGSAPGRPGQRAAWIRGAWSWLGTRRSVRAVIWFNYDKRREGEQNWRVDASVDSLGAFNETFARSRTP